MDFKALVKKERLKLQNKNKESIVEQVRKQHLKDIESGAFTNAFIEWLKTSAKTERNSSIKFDKWVEQYCRLIGDLRVNETVTSGCAQFGKSLFHYLLNLFVAEYGFFNTLYLFAKAAVRDKLVGSTVKPLLEYNFAHFKRKKDVVLKVDNNKVRVTDAFTSYYSFLNNPSVENNVSVPVEITAITVDLRIIDEISQVDQMLVAASANRQDNALIESRPVRKLGTPGREGTGVDIHIQNCHEEYYPHIICPNCGELASLHPEKALLKEGLTLDPYGKEVMSFYDQDNKPVDWYYHDPNDKINSAYIGCEHCGTEIPQEVRIHAGYYEVTSHKDIEQLFKEINLDPYKYRRIAIHVAPLLRDKKYNLAAQLIEEGLTTENPENWIQQKLGISNRSQFAGLNPRLIKRSCEAQNAFIDLDKHEKVRILGLDQARGSHYGCIMDAYIPYEGEQKDRYDKTIRVVRAFQRISLAALPMFVRNAQIEIGALDAAPELTTASQIYDDYGWIPILQKNTHKTILKTNDDAEMGGIKVPVWDVNNQYFIAQTLAKVIQIDDYGLPYTRLPGSLLQRLSDTSKTNPVQHLMGITFDEDKNMYVKGNGCRCDFFYALLFAEVALYHHILHVPDIGRYLSWFRN